MANKEPAELAEPGVGAFDDPAPLTALEFAEVFLFSLLVVVPVRDDKADAALLQPSRKRVGVVGSTACS